MSHMVEAVEILSRKSRDIIRVDFCFILISLYGCFTLAFHAIHYKCLTIADKCSGGPFARISKPTIEETISRIRELPLYYDFIVASLGEPTNMTENSKVSIVSLGLCMHVLFCLDCEEESVL